VTPDTITLIPADNPGPFTGPTGNNTWLVDGAEPLLVDAGVGAASHIDGIARALEGRPLARVFVTHGHPDHAGGVPAIRARWAEVDVIEGAAADGREMPAGEGLARVIATPGHSRDHACLWMPRERAFFAGDLLLQGGTVMIAASSGGSLREYLASLERVRHLAPGRVYPGHGPMIDDAVALIDEYVAHRQQREAQIRAAMAAGATTPDEIVAVVYPDLDPALAGAARETVLAHLQKLDEEARTRR
jgi:glyoxylase-like metal-dependent hydrolase (beta-lactamase superfamily II)